MLGQAIGILWKHNATVLNVGVGALSYGAYRGEGDTPGQALTKAVGDTLLWTAFPGTMMAIQIPSIAIPAAIAQHQFVEQKMVRAKLASSPYIGSQYMDTETTQRRRYSAINELNQSYNIARAQARRMRG